MFFRPMFRVRKKWLKQGKSTLSSISFHKPEAQSGHRRGWGPANLSRHGSQILHQNILGSTSSTGQAHHQISRTEQPRHGGPDEKTVPNPALLTAKPVVRRQRELPPAQLELHQEHQAGQHHHDRRPGPGSGGRHRHHRTVWRCR